MCIVWRMVADFWISRRARHNESGDGTLCKACHRSRSPAENVWFSTALHHHQSRGLFFLVCFFFFTLGTIVQETNLNGNSSNFTHWIVFTCLGRVYVKKSCTKPFVAPEEATRNLTNCLRWCHPVAKFHCECCGRQVLKSGRLFYHCGPHCGLIFDIFQTNDQSPYSSIGDIAIFVPHIVLSFQNLAPKLPTMQRNH